MSLCYSFNTYTSTTGSFKEYNESHTCSELLQAKGWSYVSSDSVGEKWLRDGESSNTHSATIFDYNRAYVFSTSTPLPTGQLLSPTDITVHYDFNGDKSAFGKSLRRETKTLLNLLRQRGLKWNHLMIF